MQTIFVMSLAEQYKKVTKEIRRKSSSSIQAKRIINSI